MAQGRNARISKTVKKMAQAREGIVCYKHNDPIVTLKVTLLDSPYPIWRRFGVQSIATFRDLHMAVLSVMGWDGSHLWQFKVGQQIIGDCDLLEMDPRDDTGFIDAETYTLGDAIAANVKTFGYTYDFGDNWQHKVTIEKVGPGDTDIAIYPVMLDHKGRCPPDNVGGIGGFVRFLETMGDPKSSAFKKAKIWNGGVFDPNAVEYRVTAIRLDSLAMKLQKPPKL